MRILGGRNLADYKLKLIALFAVFVMVCAVIPGTESPVAISSVEETAQNKPAAEVWSCDFDDGIPSDWEIYGFEGIIPYSNPPGSFSTDDGSLRSNSTGEVASMAHVNSSVAYGTWSFDVDVVDTILHDIVIPFIMVSWTLDAWWIDCYFFQIVTGMYGGNPQPRVQAAKGFENTESPRGKDVVWIDSEPHDDIFGWKNFIITREDNGQFYFYMNESLMLGFKDTQHTTCNQFAFGAAGGPAIDNIVVDDEVIFDAAPPEWTEPSDKTIELGQDFRYDLNATDFSGLGTWAINDTTNFAIDSNGVITNTTALALGSYGLNVSVSDSLGFTRASVFKVTVESVPTTTLPDLTLYAAAGVAGIVIIALVVVFMKKRG
ncbi:MAG: hypothetical protein ACXADL_14035 [Candidatus Thorarchaeota archaeon]